MRRSILTGITLIGLLSALCLAGLGSASAHAHAHASKVHVVKIVNTSNGSFAFSPKTVKIKAGQTVEWINKTSVAHTSTGSSWNLDPINPGKSKKHTFKKAGTFKYHCVFHPFMHGTVKVVK